MKRTNVSAKFLVTALTASVFLPVAGFAQEACSSYTVKTGDSLGSIAEIAYGSYDYQIIFNANRETIGGNPNTLEEGTTLQIPCADGRLSVESSSEDVIAQEEAKQAANVKTTNVYAPPIRLVSGNGWAPFTTEDLSGGGMVVRLATTALNRGGNSREYSVSFVDDWGSHLTTLLPLNAFDVSIAWYIPDCTKLELLSEGMAKRCTDLDHSLPIYESVVGYYTLADSEYANAREFSDFTGARFCRPEGWYTHDLEEEGLVPPAIEFVNPSQPIDCGEALLNGTADIVGMEIESMADVISELKVSSEVVQNPYLTKLLTLTFVTHKTNPRGRVYISMLNKGLTEMRESGEWYAIIASSLAEHNESLLAN